jgi:hypothetical protein
MRIFDNPSQLKRSTIDRRLRLLDVDAVSNPYVHEDTEAHRKTYYVGIDSETLTDKQIENCLGPMTLLDSKANDAATTQAEWLKIAKTEFESIKSRLVSLETAAKPVEPIQAE